MDEDVRLRALDPGRDLPLLERLWGAALGSVWPLLPGALDIVRDGVVAEAGGGGNPADGGLGVIAIDPEGRIPVLPLCPASPPPGARGGGDCRARPARGPDRGAGEGRGRLHLAWVAG